MTLEVYIHTTLIAVFLTLLAMAALSDVGSYRIPNRITIAIAALYPFHVLLSPVAIDWTGGLVVAGIVLTIGFVMFAFNVLGGGDVKMLAATVLWAGPELVFDFFIFTTLTGGLISLFWISPLRHQLALAVDRFSDSGKGNSLSATMVPYGLAVAVGGVAVAINILGLGRVV